MLKPIPVDLTDVQYQHHTTCDIETSRKGELLAVSLFYDGTEYEVYSDWGDWLTRVLELARKNKNLRTVWAHNGANFDWQHLAEWLRVNRPDIQIKFMLSGSAGISANLNIPGLKYRIWLKDSYRLLPMSLARLSKDMGIENPKIDIDEHPETLYHQNPELFYKYLRNDTLAVAEVLGKFQHIVNSEVCKRNPIRKLKSTIASQGMDVFRREFLKQNIMVPWNKKIKQWERLAYHGGLVLCPKHGTFQNCNGADVNSMYPSAMVNQPVPTSNRVRKVKKYHSKYLGIYHVRYSLPEREFLHIYNDKGILAAQGTAYITSIELEDIWKNGGLAEIIDGMIYLDSGYLLKEYAETIYQLKRTSKAEGKKALETVAKLLLNSLYGKFAQSDTAITLKSMTHEEFRKALKRGAKIKPVGNMYQVEEYMRSEHSFIAIAAFITAAARLKLLQAVRANRENVLYTDTDSIIVQGEIQGITIGKNLGEWSIEFLNCEVTTLGKKLYAVVGPEKIEKIRMKGVPLQRFPISEKAKEVEYMQGVVTVMKELTGDINKKVQFGYSSPPTNREVFEKGRKSALWVQKGRAIRATSDRAKNEREITTMQEKYEEYLQAEKRKYYREQFRELIYVIRSNGGISAYRNGYRADEYNHSVPLTVRRKTGMRADQMAELLKRDFPQFGIEDENGLFTELEKYSDYKRQYRSYA
jgi:DNA polymerase elongation subunit (family B)